MQHKSLAFRLIATSAGWSIIILAIAGYLFSSSFRSAVERSFDERLLLTLDGLLANVEVDASSALVEAANLGDSRYLFPLQGWYWQVTSLDEDAAQEIRSESLLEKRLTFPAEAYGPRDDDGLARFYYMGPEGYRLRVIEQKYQIDGSVELLSFMVTGNSDELEAEIASFNQTLLVTLSILAFGLVTAALIQVRFGVQPLHRLRSGLINVRRGRAESLEGEYPLELQPVVQELNALLQANKEMVDRARTQVGNLAHALKTPLSIVRNEVDALNSPASKKIVEQAEIMTDQLDVYLDRARRAARSHVPGTLSDIFPVIESLIRTLKRIYTHKNLTAKMDVDRSVRFLGEKQDLEEMFGNLLDNAFKWAKREVIVRAQFDAADEAHDTGKIVLEVEDDGPGLPKEQREDALVRGKRLDETKPGSGLGLSIVAETVAMYGGEIDLGLSPSGGLRVRLTLPGTGLPPTKSG
jgi:signal transduction histidine kinase